MPGIYGIVSADPAPSWQMEEDIRTMAMALRHLPTYRNHYHVGRRAAVGRIGPEAMNPEKQPIFVKGASRYLVFDGELFQPEEVAGESDKTVTAPLDYPIGMSDSARLLSALECRGVDAVPGIAGAYSAAWVDDDRGRCVLITDRLGLRSSFYMVLPDKRFAFAPELKALAALAEAKKMPLDVNEQAVSEMLLCGFCLFENALLSGTAYQGHACVIHVEHGHVRVENYWDFPQRVLRSSFDDAAADGAELLKTAVGRQLKGAGRMGVLLSGGLDSRAIIAAAVDHGVKLPAFTLGSGRNTEVKLARRVAHRLGIEHHCLEIPSTFLPDEGERGIWYSDGMFPCNHLHWLPQQLELMRQTESIISGYLGGVFIGGVFQKAALPEADQPEVAHTISSAMIGPLSPFVSEALTPRWRQRVSEGVVLAREAIYQRVGGRGYANELDRIYLMTDERRFTNLGNSAMLGTIGGVKYPFGDYDLLDFYGELPAAWRRGARLYKAMLARAFPLLVDLPAISANTRFVPARIDREPGGFVLWKRRQAAMARFIAGWLSRGRISIPDRSTYVHYAHWYRSVPRFQKWVNDILLDDRTLSRGIVSREGVRRIMSIQMKKGYVFDILARLITLEIWYRQFIDGERPEPLVCPER